MKHTHLLLSILAISFSSCEKYEEGGLISKGDDRIIGTWKVDKYLRNGTDESSTLYISNLQEVFDENGNIVRTYIDFEGENTVDEGTYEFSDDQKQIKIDGVSSIGDFSDNTSSISTSSITILKLDKEEFWYEFTNGSDEHEFHLIKQ